MWCHHPSERHMEKWPSLLLFAITGCASPAPPPPPPPPPPVRTEAARSIELQPPEFPKEPELLGSRHGPGPFTRAERDSLLHEMAVHRDAWRARKINDYRLLVASGCFCPGGGVPAILVIRGAILVALEDTTGKRMGDPREPGRCTRWKVCSPRSKKTSGEAMSSRSSTVRATTILP